MLLTTLPAIFLLFVTPVFTSSTPTPTSTAEVIQATDFSHNTKSKHLLLSSIKQEIDSTEDIVMEQYNVWNDPVDIQDDIPETSIKQEINLAEFVVMDQSNAGGYPVDNRNDYIPQTSVKQEIDPVEFIVMDQSSAETDSADTCDETPKTFMKTDTANCNKVRSGHRGKLFAKNKSQEQHMSPKIHECGQCGKRFNMKSRLNYHIITHTDDRPFTCNVCKNTFKRQSDMIAHIKRFHPHDVPSGINSQMYPCSQCGKPFVSPAQLNRHMVTHEGVKPYTCKLCGKSFGRIDGLERHTKTHSKNKSTYQCIKCGASYTSIGNLRRHVRSAHAQPELQHSPMSAASDPTSDTQDQPTTIDSTDGLYHSVTEEHNDASLSDNVGHDTTSIKKEAKQNSQKELGQISHRTIRTRTRPGNKRVFRCIHCGLSLKDVYEMEDHEKNEHRQTKLHRPTMSAAYVATSETLPVSRQHTPIKSADDISRNFIEEHIDMSRVDNFRQALDATIVKEEPMSTEQSSQGATIEKQVTRNINVEVSHTMTNEDQTRTPTQSFGDTAIVKEEPTWSEQSSESAIVEEPVIGESNINVEVSSPWVIGDQTRILTAVKDAVKTLKKEVKE